MRVPSFCTAVALALVLAYARPAPAQTGSAPDAPPAPAGRDLSPERTRAADLLHEVYWNGYFEFQYSNPHPGQGSVDFRRFVLQAGYEYSEDIDFYSELELEHAKLEGGEEGGELELEQAYLDFRLSEAATLRAGQVLMPVGILNERHEPTTFFGVERNRVETQLIPTTWFDAGLGLHGTLPAGLSYRTYLVPPLDASRFNAGGLGAGKQSGSRANLSTWASTGRLEWAGAPGLTLGASWWRGDSGFAFVRPNALEVDTRLVEADVQWRSGRLELRGMAAQVDVPDAGKLNPLVSALQGFNPNTAERMRGWYAEAGLRVLSRPRAGDVVLWARYEDVDTQQRMPAGAARLGVWDTAHRVVGISWYPHPGIGWEVEWRTTDTHNADPFTPEPPDQFNVGLGWWF